MWSGVVDAGDDIETHNATCIRKKYRQGFLFTKNRKHTVALTHRQRDTFRCMHVPYSTLPCVSPKNPQRIKWHALLLRFVCISEGGSTAEGDQEILTYIKLRFEEKGWWSRCLAGWLAGWLTVWWSVWVLVTCFAFLMRHSNTHTHTGRHKDVLHCFAY